MGIKEKKKVDVNWCCEQFNKTRHRRTKKHSSGSSFDRSVRKLQRLCTNGRYLVHLEVQYLPSPQHPYLPLLQQVLEVLEAQSDSDTYNSANSGDAKQQVTSITVASHQGVLGLLVGLVYPFVPAYPVHPELRGPPACRLSPEARGDPVRPPSPPASGCVTCSRPFSLRAGRSKVTQTIETMRQVQ